jgi:hypothetical protein
MYLGNNASVISKLFYHPFYPICKKLYFWCSLQNDLQIRFHYYENQKVKWNHDISFWFDSDLFDFNEFIDTTRVKC